MLLTSLILVHRTANVEKAPMGCDANNDACQGFLVCINNQCVADDDTGRNGVDTRNWYVMVVTGTSQLKTHVHYKAEKNNGQNANDACCHCGGGRTGGATTGGCTDLNVGSMPRAKVSTGHEVNEGWCELRGDDYANTFTGKNCQ